MRLRLENGALTHQYRKHQRTNPMKGYLYVVEVMKCKEYVPYSTRRTQDAAELVKLNAERTTEGKFRISKYERVRK